MFIVQGVQEGLANMYYVVGDLCHFVALNIISRLIVCTME